MKPPYTPEEERKIALVKQLLDDGVRAMETAWNDQMDHYEREVFMAEPTKTYPDAQGWPTLAPPSAQALKDAQLLKNTEEMLTGGSCGSVASRDFAQGTLSKSATFTLQIRSNQSLRNAVRERLQVNEKQRHYMTGELRRLEAEWTTLNQMFNEFDR